MPSLPIPSYEYKRHAFDTESLNKVSSWARHVARMGRDKVYTEFWWVNLRIRDLLDDPGVDGRIILRWIFETKGVRYGLD
jgi:hypothetical protein